MHRCSIQGTGAYLPEKRLTNADLERLVDTNEEWILQRTGIRERRIASASECTSDLAVKAAQGALEAAEEEASNVDAVIVATVTPDTYCPAAAVYVQEKLGVGAAAAFDLSAACTGFVYGLALGHSLIATSMAERVLVIGAETLSRYVDYEDRSTCILFGDGAGAALLSRAVEGSGSYVADNFIQADGAGAELIHIPAGGARLPASHDTVEAKQHFLRVQGRDVFKFATRIIVDLVERALDRNGLQLDDLKLIVPHQANYRIIEAALKRLKLPEERCFLNVERYGNTSGAAVPIALHEAVDEGRLERGDWVLLLGFGAGLTWGYNLIKW